MSLARRMQQAAAGSAGAGPEPSGWTDPDLANASYDSVSLGISAKATFPAGLWFKPDGTKMYHTNSASGIADVHEYNLSSAWDITSASFLQTKSVLSNQPNLQAVVFKGDGTAMFTTDAVNSVLYQHSLSTAWDISTASYDSKSLSASAQETQLRKVFFKPDGTKVFLTGSIGDSVYEYSLGTAWDISTASYLSTFSVSAQDGSPSSLFFNPDGTKMFFGGVTSDVIYQYSLSNPWDLSTAAYDSISFSVASQDGTPQAIFFKPDGSKMYLSGATNDTIYQYSTA